MSLYHLREHYDRGELLESYVNRDPIAQCRAWLEEAIAAKIPDANAMALATVDPHGRPSNRMVLVKDISPAGLTFFTNYASRKGEDLAKNPNAALLFFWAQLHRQIRIDGTVARIPREESEAYFRTRPYLSQLGAAASAQSAPIPDRETLEAKFTALMEKYPEGGPPIPMPTTWGGYLLTPRAIELWQGRPGRLHDRLRFTRATVDANEWTLERLQP